MSWHEVNGERRWIENGSPVGDELCPECEEYSVVYNGNYFCDDQRFCGWVLPERGDAAYEHRLIKTYCKQEGIEVREAWIA